LEKIFLYRKAIRIKPNYNDGDWKPGHVHFTIQDDNPSLNMDELIDRDPDSVEKEAKYFQAGVDTFKAKNIIKPLSNSGKPLL